MLNDDVIIATDISIIRSVTKVWCFNGNSVLIYSPKLGAQLFVEKDAWVKIQHQDSLTIFECDIEKLRTLFINYVIKQLSNNSNLIFLQVVGKLSVNHTGCEVNSLDHKVKGWLRDLNMNFQINTHVDRFAFLYMDSDIKKLKEINNIMRGAIKHVIEDGVIGLKEYEIAIKIENQFVVEAYSKLSPYSTRCYCYVMSNKRSCEANKSYNISTNNIIIKDTAVLIEVAGMVDGLWCDLSETHYQGEDEEIIKAEEFCINFHDEIMNHTFTKRNVNEIFDFYWDKCKVDPLLRKYAEPFLGHTTGYRYHGDNEISAKNNNSVIFDGSVWAIEPGFYKPQSWGYRLERNYIYKKGNFIQL